MTNIPPANTVISAVLLRRLFHGKDLKLALGARTEILPVRYARKTAELLPNRLPGECWPSIAALRRGFAAPRREAGTRQSLERRGIIVPELPEVEAIRRVIEPQI